MCGRFQLIPDLSFDTSDVNPVTKSISNSDSLAVEVDSDNRKLFEDFEKKLQSEAGDEVKLIKYGSVYLKVYLSEEGKMIPKCWKVFEKDGKEYKKSIWNKEYLNWKNIEGEIVFSIEKIFVGKNKKSIICVAKEILVRGIMEEKSYFEIPVDEDSEVFEE